MSPRYTTVPDAYFEKKRAGELFTFNIHGEHGKVLNNLVSETGYHILFDLDEELYSFLCRNLWNPAFYSHQARLHPFLSNYRNEGNRKRCFVDFHDEMVSVTCFYGTRLLSSNTYPARERYEALFNIANVWEHQSLDQNTDLLVFRAICGEQRKCRYAAKTHKKRGGEADIEWISLLFLPTSFGIE